MGVCMMVASGLNLDVDAYLRRSPFKPVSVFRKGQIPSQGNPGRIPRPDSGFLVIVSQDAEPGLARQIPESLSFLIAHEKELGRLRAAGMDNCLLEFAVEPQAGNQTGQYLPPEVIIALARFRMGLSFSVVQLPKG